MPSGFVLRIKWCVVPQAIGTAFDTPVAVKNV